MKLLGVRLPGGVSVDGNTLKGKLIVSDRKEMERCADTSDNSCACMTGLARRIVAFITTIT